MPDQDNILEARRLLGFALFNLNKGKLSAVETLISKAIKELESNVK